MTTHIRARVDTAIGLYAYRLLGAATLDAGMYETIEANRATTGQALATVILASVAAGLGAGSGYGGRLATVAGVTAIAVLTWGAWAMLVFQIGTRLLPRPQTEADWGQLLRTTGFAAAPGLLQVFASVPEIRTIVFSLTSAWMFVAMVFGVRHGLDYQSTRRALAVCGLAAALSIALAFVMSLCFSAVVASTTP
jgi:hypothetical protein